MPAIGWFFLLVLALAVFGLVSRMLFSLWRARGILLVTCPENRQCAAVELDHRRVVADSLRSQPSWRLSDCSRWPEMSGCTQPCVTQLAGAPGDCRLRQILASWYQDRSCTDCGKKFATIHWHDHQPGLFDEEGIHHDWEDFAPQSIPDVLARARPLCWDCLVAREFRQRFPELVTDRDHVRADTPGIWTD